MSRAPALLALSALVVVCSSSGCGVAAHGLDTGGASGASGASGGSGASGDSQAGQAGGESSVVTDGDSNAGAASTLAEGGAGAP